MRLPYPIVVPGGRFRESYYWDSYWIVLGLLACDMNATATGVRTRPAAASFAWLCLLPRMLRVCDTVQVVMNFMDMINSPLLGELGFVPNGARVYYLNRSQPPLLSEMIKVVYEATHDLQFLKKGVPALDMEYKYWMKSAQYGSAVNVTVNGVRYTLNRYATNWTQPRPESWLADVNTVRGVVDWRGCLARG